MSNTFKWHMLITSFIPLWFSILIIDLWHLIEHSKLLWNDKCNFFYNISFIFKHKWIVIVFLIIVFLNVIISSIYISRFIKKQTENEGVHNKISISNVKQCTSISSEYLIAYILPMLVFDFTSLMHIILFVLYFSTLATLSIRNNHVYVNLLLEFKKYKIYNADVTKKIMEKSKLFTNCIIISKNDLCIKNNSDITYFDFENTVYLDLTMENLDDNNRN